MKRAGILMCALVMALGGTTAWAQKKDVRLSIATGGTGGVYYPLGGGMASVISKHVAYIEATAEVTSASVDNCLLVGAGKADLALVMADTALDAFQAKGKFKDKLPIRTAAVLYPNNMHVVTVEGKGIEKISDLKGKRVSTGSPGSGTEVMALRVLEAFGIDPEKDLKRDKLGASESAGALKDGKIDAYFWVGGLPTASVTDLGATPGIKLKLVGHDEAVSKMNEKYGPLYVKGKIPAKTYPGQDADVPIAVVWNLLICNEKAKESVIYDVLKALFENKSELVAVHQEGKHLEVSSQKEGSPIPFHPGAVKFFGEKGVTLK